MRKTGTTGDRFDWRMTIRVRRAVQEGRVLVSEHAREKAVVEGLHGPEILELLATGVVRSFRQRDEQRTAIDGYKHFLLSTTPSGRLFEVVFKFIRAQESGPDELVVLITLYRGKV